ncbi:MAG: SH3 domain-containing protein [Lachnospiraceae bacterium]
MKKLSVILVALMLGTAGLAGCSKSADTQLKTKSETEFQWGLTMNGDGTDAETAAAESDEESVMKLDNGVLLLKVDDIQVAAVSDVNVRSGPGIDYDKEGSLSGSETATMTGICSNEWIRIDFNGDSGYVSMNYLTALNDEVSLSALLDQVQALESGGNEAGSEEESGSEESSADDSSAGDNSESSADDSSESSADGNSESSVDESGESNEEGQAAWAITDVNVRTGPKASYGVLGYLAKGQSIRVLDSSDAWWWKVEFNGQEGYISAQYLTTEKPAE